MNVSQFDLTFSDPRIFWSDGDLVYALNGGLRVANEKGKTFLELFSNQLLVNLHYFDGYDQFLYDPATGEAKITIEGQEYANKLGEAKVFASGMTLLNTKSNVYPALEFSIFNPDGTTANRDVLITGMAAVLDEYGLTCTEGDFKTLLQNGLEYRDSLVGFEAKKVMERTYEDIVDYDKALRFFEPLGEEGVGAYFNAESLDKDEQVEDEEYYALTPATYAGEATIKDDSVDFSSLSLALEPNSLLLEASQYRLALLYKGLSENLTYNGAPAIYEGEPLTLAFDGSITLPADLDDEFEVYAYVENENGQRLSSLFPVKAVEGLDLLLDEGSTAYHYFEENGYLKLSAAPTEDEEIGREEEPNAPDEGEEAGPNEPEASQEETEPTEPEA